jgi:isocitrate dehydrogenase
VWDVPRRASETVAEGTDKYGMETGAYLNQRQSFEACSETIHGTTRAWIAETLRTIGVGVLAWGKMRESLAKRDDDVPSGEVWGHQLLGG